MFADRMIHNVYRYVVALVALVIVNVGTVIVTSPLELGALMIPIPAVAAIYRFRSQVTLSLMYLMIMLLGFRFLDRCSHPNC